VRIRARGRRKASCVSIAAPQSLIDTIEGDWLSIFATAGYCTKWERMAGDRSDRAGQGNAITAWKMQGRDGRFTVYRLKGAYRTRSSFVKAAQVYEGRPYDYHYDMDDAAIYCSELIYKAFRTAPGGTSVTCKSSANSIGNLTSRDQQLEGGQVPLERLMITPRALSMPRSWRRFSSRRNKPRALRTV